MVRALSIVIPLIMAIYACVDCVQTDEDAVKGLPKVVWVFVILLFPVVGSIAWFVAGRPRPVIGGLPGTGRGIGGPPRRPRGPDDDPDFLKGL